MLPTSPTILVRSSLEEMLENLRRRDAKPWDLPPALPSRPTSRGRLPSARRSFPANLTIGQGNEEVKRKSDGASEKRSYSFGKKKDKSDQNSPYSRSNSQEAAGPGSSGKAASITSVVEWENNIGYFIKKKLFIWCRVSSRQWESGIIQ